MYLYNTQTKVEMRNPLHRGHGLVVELTALG